MGIIERSALIYMRMFLYIENVVVTPFGSECLYIPVIVGDIKLLPGPLQTSELVKP